MKKESLGYSKWTLQPNDPGIARLYSNYTRSQVQKMSLPIAIIMLVFLLANIAIIISKKEFKIIKIRYTSMVIYFFFTAVLTLFSFANWIIAKKWNFVSELVIPAYGVVITIILLPAWY